MTEGLKTEVISVPASWVGSRDAGKVFVIKEWPAIRAEKWAWRMFLVLKGSEGQIPQDVKNLGMVGVAIVGLNIILRSRVDDPAELERLLDEMLTCVSIVRNPRDPETYTPIVSETDVMDVKTLLWLRSEVLRVHTGFSSAEAVSSLLAAAMSSQGSQAT